METYIEKDSANFSETRNDKHKIGLVE